MKAIVPALLLLAVGCTTTSYMRDAKATQPPGPDEAKVVVYRDSAIGGVDHYPIFEYANEDGNLLGFTETNCYFEFRCKPGKHFFLTWGEGDAFIEATLDGGKTYYLRAWSKFGLVSSRPVFVPVLKGSDDLKDLKKVWPELRCRELDPAQADAYEIKKEDRVQKAHDSYEAGSKAAKILKAEDGQTTPTPQ